MIFSDILQRDLAIQLPIGILKWQRIFQWIGLRENLQETIDFPIKYGVFL